MIPVVIVGSVVPESGTGPPVMCAAQLVWTGPAQAAPGPGVSAGRLGLAVEPSLRSRPVELLPQALLARPLPWLAGDGRHRRQVSIAAGIRAMRVRSHEPTWTAGTSLSGPFVHSLVLSAKTHGCFKPVTELKAASLGHHYVIFWSVSVSAWHVHLRPPSCHLHPVSGLACGDSVRGMWRRPRRRLEQHACARPSDEKTTVPLPGVADAGGTLHMAQGLRTLQVAGWAGRARRPSFVLWALAPKTVAQAGQARTFVTVVQCSPTAYGVCYTDPAAGSWARS